MRFSCWRVAAFKFHPCVSLLQEPDGKCVSSALGTSVVLPVCENRVWALWVCWFCAYILQRKQNTSGNEVSTKHVTISESEKHLVQRHTFNLKAETDSFVKSWTARKIYILEFQSCIILVWKWVNQIKWNLGTRKTCRCLRRHFVGLWVRQLSESCILITLSLD